jgi:serine/threonine protein kinase
MRPRGLQLIDDGLCAAYRTTPVNGESAELWVLKEEHREARDAVSMFADGCAFLERFPLQCLPRLVERSADHAVLIAPPWVMLDALRPAGAIAPPLVITFLRGLVRDLARLPPDVALRSIGPRELAITTTGAPRILGTMLARFSGRSTKTQPGVIKGSLRYLSPEAISGDRVFAASDIFALGLLVHELLCGAHPITATNDMDVLMQLRVAQIPQLAARRPDLPVALTTAVDRMVAGDPADRISAAELAEWIDARLATWLLPADYVFAEVAARAPAAAEAAVLFGI